MSISPPSAKVMRRITRTLDGAGRDFPLSGVGGRRAEQPWYERCRPTVAGSDSKPTDKENAVQAVVDINGHGISTSGSYRNYYELDGKRLSHVIDPQTGRPIEHNLVSVTVIAPTALEADARDTGLMVLGPEKAKEVVRREGLAVYMITKEGDNFKARMSPQFKSFLISEKIKAQDCWFCAMVTGQTKGYP